MILLMIHHCFSAFSTRPRPRYPLSQALHDLITLSNNHLTAASTITSKSYLNCTVRSSCSVIAGVLELPLESELSAHHELRGLKSNSLINPDSRPDLSLIAF
jgi:hypothetical protein